MDMSRQGMTAPVTTGTGAQPPRVTVASYATYQEAQRAVDKLSDEKFPVERSAIVAEGIRFVEQVTGRLNWWRALLNGALSGGLIGAFIGFVFGLFSFFQPGVAALTLALNGLVIGAVIGAIVGLVGYSFTGGRRDFTSVSGMQAERYNVMVDADLETEAKGIIASL